jgi:hypothetical protein
MTTTINEPDDLAQQANATIRSANQCVVRDDGKKSHVFLDGGNKCVCGDVDLLAYREAVLS